MRISDWSSDVCSSDLALVQGGGLYVEYAVCPVDREPARLFDDKAHRVRLVHQTQLAVLAGGALVARVDEYTAPGKKAMDVGDHGGDPAHVEVFAARAGGARQAFVYIAFDRRVPVAHVRHVDGEFGCVLRDGDVCVDRKSTRLNSSH